MTMPIDSFRNPVGNELAQALKTTRAQITDLTIKQTSGQRYSNLRELGELDLSAEYVSGISKLQELQSLENSTKATTAHLTKQKDIISSIRDTAMTARDEIISNFSDPTKIPDIISVAISHIQNLLNTQFGNEYLFGGSNSYLPPVDLTPSSIINGSISANYSSAISISKNVRITPTQSLTINLDANNKAFEELVGALHIMRDSTNYETDYSQFIGLIENSLNKLSNLEVQLVDKIRTTEEASVRNNMIKISVIELVEELFTSDPIELKAQIDERNSILQIIMIAISNLSKLSLADYIH